MLRTFNRICAVALLATTVQSCVDSVDTCVANTGTQEECDLRVGLANGVFDVSSELRADACVASGASGSSADNGASGASGSSVGGSVTEADDKCTFTQGFRDVADYDCAAWNGYDCGTDVIFCDDALESTDYTLADCAAVRDNCCAMCAVFTRDDTVCADNGAFKDDQGNGCDHYAELDCGDDASLRGNCCQSCTIFDAAQDGHCEDVGADYSNMAEVQEACLYHYAGATWNGYNCNDVYEGGYCTDTVYGHDASSYPEAAKCCAATCDCECTGDCPVECEDVGADIEDETEKHAAQEKCLFRGGGSTWSGYYCEYDPSYCNSYQEYYDSYSSYPEYEECCQETCAMSVPLCSARKCHSQGAPFTCDPTQEPTHEPTNKPSGEPSNTPSNQPSNLPTNLPSGEPSNTPSNQPSNLPTNLPSSEPTGIPSYVPTEFPTEPTNVPSQQPSQQPTQTTNEPTHFPTIEPSNFPTEEPTSFPTEEPTQATLVDDDTTNTSQQTGTSQMKSGSDVDVTTDQTTWITKALKCGTCTGDIDITLIVVGGKISKENWDELPEEEMNAIMDAAKLDGTCTGATVTVGTCTVVAGGATSAATSLKIQAACCGGDPFPDCPATYTWADLTEDMTEEACTAAMGDWTQSGIAAKLERLNEAAEEPILSLISSATMLSAGATLLILLF